MKTKICVLSAPPEIEIDEKLFNKACCLVPDLGICDFINLPEKGLSRMTAYDCEISFVSSAKKISIKIESIDSKSAQPVSVVIGKK